MPHPGGRSEVGDTRCAQRRVTTGWRCGLSLSGGSHKQHRPNPQSVVALTYHAEAACVRCAALTSDVQSAEEEATPREPEEVHEKRVRSLQGAVQETHDAIAGLSNEATVRVSRSANCDESVTKKALGPRKGGSSEE